MVNLLVSVLLAVHIGTAHSFRTNLASRDVFHSPSLPSIVGRKQFIKRHHLSMSASVEIAPPQQVKKIKIEGQDWKVVPDIWETLAKTIPEQSMLVDTIHGDEKVDLSYSQANDAINAGAASFQSLGVKPGECVSVFSENSHRWFLTEQAIMKCGGSNAVRGAMAPVPELQYIYENSLSVGAVVESPNLLQSIYKNGGFSNEKGAPKFIVVLYSRGSSSAELTELIDSSAGTRVLTFEDFSALAKKEDFKAVARDSNSAATLVYTSGTTSKPKGVVLEHRNLMAQIFFNSFNRKQNNKYDPWVGDVFVSILPCWHIFERTAEYFCLSRGAQMVYSNLRNFKKI